MTYEDAMKQVMIDNGGFAPLKLIYNNIEKYRKILEKHPIKRYKKEHKDAL